MKNENIHAVVIACPTKFHKEIVVAVAKVGKHIFCEKPMAMDEAESEVLAKSTI